MRERPTIPSYLGGGVVGHAAIADQARGQRSVQHCARHLRPEEVGCGPGDVEAPLQVHLNDPVEVVLGHLVKGRVARNAGDAGDRIDTAEGVDRLLHHRPGIRESQNVAAIGRRLAAAAFDQRDDLVGGARIVAVAPRGAAKVVDDNRGPFPGGKQGDLPADAMTTAGHQDNLAFESTTAGHRDSPIADFLWTMSIDGHAGRLD